MKEQTSHPGRSAEFLSRLHDGELTPAERAHFESHRAHCAECRHAAADFETALSLYRSNRSAPARPDLAARILRKLQTSSNRPRAFGAVFGIDLRWAAAFATALSAFIIGSSVVLRREARHPAAPESATIPVFLEETKAPKDVSRQEAPAAPTANRLARPVEVADKRERASQPSRAPRASVPAPLAAQSPEASKAKAAQESSAQSGTRRASELDFDAVVARPNAEPAGGEGAPAGSTVPGEGPAVRLVILSADEETSVPALLPGASLEPLAGERGREFFVVVETQGRVRDIQPVDNRRLKTRRAVSAAPPPSPGLQTLHELRFAPGDRPRRLLVRVE